LAHKELNRIRVDFAVLNVNSKRLADKLNKNQSTTSLLFNNARQPSLETLKEITEKFKVDVHSLITSPKSEKAS